jgi:enterobacterial common antigen flippase
VTADATAERVTHLGRSYALTLAGSGGVLVLTVYTGALSARLLAPDGRGVVGAIAAWAMLASFLGAMGVRDGMTWQEARNGSLAPVILTSTLVTTLVLSVLTFGITQILVPIGFRAQSDTVIFYARVAMLWVLPYMFYTALGSVFGARQRFAAITAMRVAQPLLYAVGLTIAWSVGRAGIPEVLALQALSFALPAVVAAAVLVAESGLGGFDAAVTRRSAAYGIRAYGGTIGTLANSRLDLLVIPAVLLAADIGLYVVAISAASMIVGLFGSLHLVVFPAAARRDEAHRIVLIQRAVRLVVTASVLSAIVLGFAAPWLVTTLYGSDFAGAVAPLRLLLPGVCCWAAASVMTSGLKALGQPGAASAAQFIGVGVTVVGLVVLLPPLGIAGAAITSTASYATVFALLMLLFARSTRTRIRDTLGARALIRDIGSMMGRLRRPGGGTVTSPVEPRAAEVTS